LTIVAESFSPGLFTFFRLLANPVKPAPTAKLGFISVSAVFVGLILIASGN